MDFILFCSLTINLFYALPEVKKFYLEYKNKKDILLYKDE